MSIVFTVSSPTFDHPLIIHCPCFVQDMMEKAWTDHGQTMDKVRRRKGESRSGILIKGLGNRFVILNQSCYVILLIYKKVVNL